LRIGGIGAGSRRAPEPDHTVNESLEILSPVAFFKRIPRQPDREKTPSREVREPDDRAVWLLQLKEEWSEFGDVGTALVGRLPEVDFLE
ncbi:MAG: hypothetical protein ACREN3_12290, partial [Gemmatimonadaceae bacterium]